MRLLIFFCCMILLPHAALAKRVALVIGNGAYKVQPALKNPVADAMAIAERLTAANFQVTLGTDLTNEGMRRKINEFAVTVPGSEAALLFFAGHGVQVDGENYLIPIDANIERVADLTWQTIQVSTLVSELEGRGRTSIIILDACRNNPGLARRLRGLDSGTRQLAVGRGLAQISAPDGTYIAFSTAPDTYAFDGHEKHSPFATALIKHLLTPGIDIALMMRRVRRDVRLMTQREQTPWDSSSLTQDFYLMPKKVDPSPPVTAKIGISTQEPNRISGIPKMSAREAFKVTQSIGSCSAYDFFLKDYPKGFFANMAKAWKEKNCQPNKQTVTQLSESLKGDRSSKKASSIPATPKRKTLEPNATLQSTSRVEPKKLATPTRSKTTTSRTVLPNGNYKSSWGVIRLKCRKTGSCIGRYRGEMDGQPAKIVGRISPTGVFRGYWAEVDSLRKCSTTKYGTRYWGKVTLRFNANRSKANGAWGYCNKSPKSAWQLRRS